MSGTTIFQDYKTRATLLTLNDIYDPNSPARVVVIDGTSYYIIGWTDSFVNSSYTRYLQLSTEVAQGGLNLNAGTMV